MKIKMDFVTNSSSVCYVVFIPQSFVVTDKMIDEGVKEASYWWEFEDGEVGPTVESLRKEIDECIEALKEGDNLYTSAFSGGVDKNTFAVLQVILDSNNLSLNSVEVSGDGETIVLGIQEELINKIILANTDLTSFIKVKK